MSRLAESSITANAIAGKRPSRGVLEQGKDMGNTEAQKAKRLRELSVQQVSFYFSMPCVQ